MHALSLSLTHTLDTCVQTCAQLIKFSSDLNNTQHSIDSTHAALTGANGAELNLRQFVEMRQLLVNINKQASSLLLSSSSNSNSIGQQRSAIELIGNVVGNYTCTASNIHGTKSVSLPLQIQGMFTHHRHTHTAYGARKKGIF